ncbi:hypothetical protein EON65_24320 [archaeon]|nr:MAG: hypothetical protein EON65_24320 [archaeon]
MLNITSGSLIQLESAIKTHNATFLVEIVQRDVAKNVNKTLLATAKNPYLRLHLHTSGPVYKEVSSPNRDCLVHIEEVFGDNAQISYRLFTYADGKQTTRNYLAWSDNEGLAVLPIEKQDDTELHVNRSFTLFAISVVNHISSSPFPTVLSPTASLHSSSPITKKQLRDLAIHGYLVLPNIVNQTKVSQCSGYFLHHVGQVGFLIPGAVQGGGYGKFPGSMSQSKVIKELFTTELKQVVEHVLGGDIDQINNLNTQIAFRFPELPPHGKSRDSSMIGKLKYILRQLNLAIF